jgi:hypothetical protein
MSEKTTITAAVTRANPAAISAVIASFRDQDWKFRYLNDATRQEITTAIEAVPGVAPSVADFDGVKFWEIPGGGVEIHVMDIHGTGFQFCPIPSTHDLNKRVWDLEARLAALEAKIAAAA